jgi:hypothetical protein
MKRSRGVLPHRSRNVFQFSRREQPRRVPTHTRPVRQLPVAQGTRCVPEPRRLGLSNTRNGCSQATVSCLLPLFPGQRADWTGRSGFRWPASGSCKERRSTSHGTEAIAGSRTGRGSLARLWRLSWRAARRVHIAIVPRKRRISPGAGGLATISGSQDDAGFAGMHAFPACHEVP